MGWRTLLHTVAVGAVVSFASWASLPPEIEPDYARALLAFQRSDALGALAILQAPLKVQPDSRELLELEALCQTSIGKEADAASTHYKLIQLLLKQKKPLAEIAPYAFQYGVLKLAAKQTKEARKGLKLSIQGNFNLPASHFFLGVIEYQEKSWDASEREFRQVIVANTPDLHPAAYWYLAQLSQQQNDVPTVIEHLSDARELSREEIANTASPDVSREIAKQVLSAVDQALQGFNTSRWFGNAGLSTGYDSNVFNVPNSAASTATGASGQSSVRSELVLGLGYASAPLEPWQIVPRYKTSFNFNFNHEARSGQFFNHDLAVYLTHTPLGRTSYGLKLQGLASLQYAQDLDTGSSGFSSYSLAGSLGPYFRHELFPRWYLSVEAFFEPQKFYTDDDAPPTFARSGWQQTLRTALRRDDQRGWWNPGFGLVATYNRTSGEEFRAKTLGLQLMETMYPLEPLMVATTLTLGVADYSSRPVNRRTDHFLTFDILAAYRLGGGFYGGLQSNLTLNGSNASEYAFNRWVFLLSGSYLF